MPAIKAPTKQKTMVLPGYNSFRFRNVAAGMMRLAMLITLPVLGYPQPQADTDTIKPISPVYIARVDTIINLKLNVNSEFEQFEVKGDNFFYDIRPNITLSSRIAFSYRFISFGIGFKPKFIPGNNDNDLQGKTRTLSFGINLQSKHWLQDLQFGYVTGFYLHNTADYAPTPDWEKGSDPYIMFPDLKVVVLRGSTGYKFIHNFLLNAGSVVNLYLHKKRQSSTEHKVPSWDS